MLNYNSSFSSFSVDDITKAKNFYQTILGISCNETPEGLRLLLSPTHEVFIYPKPNHVPATFTVLNFIVTDMEHVVDELISAGVIFEQYNNEWLKTNQKGISRGPDRIMAWFTDPTGNYISLIQKIVE